MGKFPNKPEFRDVLFYDHLTSIPAVHWWLYQTCDRYLLRPAEERCYNECCVNDNNGANWMYQFVIHSEGDQEFCLNFMSYYQHSLWITFTVNGETTRNISMKGVNPFELCRRVRDKVSEVYRYMHEHCAENAQGLCWVLSTVEADDGLHDVREFVYSKYFVLEKPASWEDPLTGELAEPDPEDMTRFFIPLDLLGEIFVPDEEEAA